MKIKVPRLTTHEKCFYFLWGLYSFTSFFLEFSELSYMYDLSTIRRIIQVAIDAALLVMMVTMNRYTLRRLIVFLLIIFCLFLIELRITHLNFLTYMLFVMCMPYGRFDRFVSFDLLIKITGAVIIFTLCAAGFIDNYVHITAFAEKQSLGFSHPNIMSMFIFTVLLEWMYLRFKRMRLFDWIAILGIWLIIYDIAASRTSAYVFLLIYLLFIAANYFPNIFYSRFVRGLFAALMPLTAAFSFICVWQFRAGNPAFISMDTLLSGRWTVTVKVLQKYGFHLFGQELELFSTRTAKLHGVSYFNIDNAYFYCLLQYGIIFFIFFCAAYIYILYYAMRKHNLQLALFCAFFILTGFGEPYLLNPLYNIVVLCLLTIKEMSYGGERKVGKRKNEIPELRRRLI